MERERCEALYRQHAQSLIRYCTFSAGTRQDGEDIAAEVFARLLKREQPMSDDATARWLFAVARNLCASHHRTLKRRALLHLRLVEQQPPTADAWVDRSVWEYLRPLKEGARQIVYLHVVEGRPFAEIARLLGRSTSAVKMTHYRALERIRKRMTTENIGAADLMGGPNDA